MRGFARRLELGLAMAQVAHKVGVTCGTIYCLERDRHKPSAATAKALEHFLHQHVRRHRSSPRIFEFIGHDPEPPPEALPGRLLAVRTRLGLTQAELAARLGQDEHQICRWERGRRNPHPWIAGRIDLALRTLEGRPAGDAYASVSFFDAGHASEAPRPCPAKREAG